MNTLKQVFDFCIFGLFWLSAIKLIEYQADELLVEFAGDVFGALALMGFTVYWLDREEE